LKRDFKYIKDQNYDPVEDAGSVRFLDELEDIPNDFVEIIHSLRRIDVQATNFWILTPYDGLVRKSYHYESKGTLFLDSQPVEWVNKNQTNIRTLGLTGMFNRVPGVDWYDRYSFGISDPRLVGTPEVRLPDKPVKAKCPCGGEGPNDERCVLCGYKFTEIRNPKQPSNNSAINLVSKFRQVSISSTKDGRKWKGNDYGTGLKEALSNDPDIARLIRNVGALEIHSFSQKYQGWVVEGGRHCRKITNTTEYWSALNQIAQRLSEIDIICLFTPDGAYVDEYSRPAEEMWALLGVAYMTIFASLYLANLVIQVDGPDASWMGSVFFMLVFPPMCFVVVFCLTFFNPLLTKRFWYYFGSLLIRLGIRSKWFHFAGLSLVIYIFLANLSLLPLAGFGISNNPKINLEKLIETNRCVECDLYQRDLTGANLVGANLSEANLGEAKLDGADLSWADLTGAVGTWAHLAEANLRHANLTGANMYGPDLTDADLSHANLREAYLPHANLSGADLSSADLTEANLFRSHLTGADLEGTNLTEAKMFEAKLTNANLSGADLSSADLTGANLVGANFQDANLDDVICNHYRGRPCLVGDFTGALNVPAKYLKD
jgi:uncharacterized protein YjbI with pentapeptide repeats